MAFTVPTADDLKSRFPIFRAEDDETIDFALTDAARMVDDSWSAQDDFTMGRLLYAAHVLTIEGYGAGGEARASSGALAGFSVIKSGKLTLERSNKAEPVAGGIDTTSFGRRFMTLQAHNRGGPVLAREPA